MGNTSSRETKTNNSKNQKNTITDQKKNLIITVVASAIVVLLLGGIIAAIAISSAPKDPTYVEMDFGSYGKIVIELDHNEAPITAKNFKKLVENGFYDGLTIFRAQSGFVIQGGKDDTKNVATIKGEFSSNGVENNISHKRGVISMARTNDPNSASSQFFITIGDASYSLDGSYAAFGYVIEGMDVVDAIAAKLISCPSDYMGFVSESNAITIVKATVLKDYEKPTENGEGESEVELPEIIEGYSYVEMDFGSFGKVVIELDHGAAPITAGNFRKLVESGFYDGLTIFRAQEYFVIQGGRDTTGSVKPIKGEFSANGVKNDISHVRGVISMARTNDPNSATSQFFITIDDARSSLDGKYAAFGHVIEGMDVIDAVADALLECPSDSMGFVSDSDAVKIVSAVILNNYEK